MAGTFETSTPEILEHLKSRTENENNSAAYSVLAKAASRVPQMSNAPYATNALRESGHVVDRSGGAYSEAVMAARAARADAIASGDTYFLTTLLTAGDVLPSLAQPNKEAYRNKKQIDFPLVYAMAIHEGFVGPTGNPVESRPFLQESLDEMEPEFIETAGQLLKELEDFVFIPLATRERLREYEAARRQAREVRSDAGAKNQETFAEFAEAGGESLKPLPGETMGEMWNRVNRNAEAALGRKWNNSGISNAERRRRSWSKDSDTNWTY